jgi:hypothetical protein
MPWKVVVAALLGGAVFGLLAMPHRLADASSHVLMADSLLHDHDLRYEPGDLARAHALHFEDLPAGLFLVRHGDARWTYGKPVPYAFAALPWYALFGPRGFLGLNGMLLAALVLLGAATVQPQLGWRRGTLVAALVYAGSIVPVYLHWIDPFLFLTALIALGIAAHHRGWPALSGATFGVAAAYRVPYAIIAMVPLALDVYRRRGAAALRFAGAAGAVALVVGLLTYASLGQWSPYTGDRFYFETLVPFETPDQVGVPFSRSNLNEQWHLENPVEIARGLGYFLAGRSAGILLYFPTFFACLLWVRRWTVEKVLWLGAVLAFALALELMIPHNRSGGVHALGNRFFVLLPIALCFVDFVAWQPWRIAGSLFVGALALPIVQAPVEHSREPGRAMLAWPQRLFPFEWPLAEHVSYPAEFPGLLALTENQYYWETPPGAVWTIGGTRAEFVVVRRGDQPARVKLWSLLPEGTVSDGGVERTLHFDGAAHEITLEHPMVVYRNEYGRGGETAVYALGIETSAAVRLAARGGSEDRRALGVFVQPVR